MILGVGIDIIEVARIRAAVERLGERFLERILTPGERGYCGTFANPAPHWAARFAAKEAVSKAFGTGIGTRLSWQDIEVARHASGQPYVILHPQGRRLLESVGADRLHLSLSHTQQYAAAVATLEGLGIGDGTCGGAR
jgi:holo-[acyl-carrier protein] synthase